MLVGVGEVGSRDFSTNPHRVEQDSLGLEAGFDVAKALPVGELGKSHAKKLVPRGKAPACPWHWVLGNAAIELLPMYHICNLRENETASIHARQPQQGRKRRKSNSNASQ